MVFLIKFSCFYNNWNNVQQKGKKKKSNTQQKNVKKKKKKFKDQQPPCPRSLRICYCVKLGMNWLGERKKVKKKII